MGRGLKHSGDVFRVIESKCQKRSSDENDRNSHESKRRVRNKFLSILSIECRNWVYLAQMAFSAHRAENRKIYFIYKIFREE
jgi:hypothetical protein